MTTSQDPAPEQAPTPEQEAAASKQLLGDRRRKLDRLRDEFKLDPFGQRVDGLIPVADAIARFDTAADEAYKAGEAAAKEAKKAGEEAPEVVDSRPTVRVAGRVMQHRVMGSLIFMSIRDASGDIQLAYVCE